MLAYHCLSIEMLVGLRVKKAKTMSFLGFPYLRAIGLSLKHLHNWWRNQMTRASFFSLSISSSTEEMITPDFLLGGSVTWMTSKSDLISTFNSSGVYFFMTLDFAFIIFGSVAYLGWFSLKSVLHKTNIYPLPLAFGATNWRHTAHRGYNPEPISQLSQQLYLL